MLFSRIALLTVAAIGLQADVRDCVCDLRSHLIAQARGCGLCRFAATHEADASPAFLLTDNDPSKPNRWLALPDGVYECHAHLHIGKPLDGQETPAGNRLHVHPNGQATEYVLMK